MLSAATKEPDHDTNSTAATQTIVAASGQQIARVQQVGRDLKVTINRGTNAGFATFLVEQLPRLFETYVETRQRRTAARCDHLVFATPKREQPGKRKKAPETEFRKPFSLVWRLRESHFRESLSRVSAPFRRADFLCLIEAKNMDPHLPTTPFGRRPLSLAMVAAQAAAKACPEDATAHKWRVFRNLTEAKDRLGLSDRALAVLSALLTFHPDTALTPGDDLVVFPSNRELCVRAHGPAPATLRRALAQLVAAGLVIRRDSPNGKRYARRGEGGSIEQAFGFDLTPLVARAAEFERLAGEVRAEARARHLLREEISLHRRDIAKTIATAFEESLPGPWSDLADRFRQLGGMPPRSAACRAPGGSRERSAGSAARRG